MHIMLKINSRTKHKRRAEAMLHAQLDALDTHMTRDEAIEYMRQHGGSCNTPGLRPPPGWGFVNDGRGWYLMCHVENRRASPNYEPVPPIFDAIIPV